MAVDVGEVIINFVGFVLILPFDIFLIYHIITRHNILCSPYFVAMTINSITGAMYMFYSAYLDLNENRFMRTSYKFFQYFIPMLSLITSVNRFTAVIFWSHHDKIWKWKFLVVYLLNIFLIALMLLLVNQYDVLGLRSIEAFSLYFRLIDRVFKATVYLLAFFFEITAVCYRTEKMQARQIDKIGRALLMQALISTISWLINCSVNLIASYYPFYPLNVLSNMMVLSGFVLPLVYLFFSNRKLTTLFKNFYHVTYLYGTTVRVAHLSTADSKVQTKVVPSGTIAMLR